MPVIRYWLVICLLATAAPLLAQEAELRPITHEDVWLMKRLASPVVSPDGRHAVVSVTEPSYEEDEEVSDLWLITIDGSEPPRRLTATPSGESGVDWRPDGGAIAFSAKRSDAEDAQAQIFVMDMTGPGEAQQVTEFATGASSPKWGPDGERIAFESEVWPGAEGSEANAEREKADEEDGINASRYEHFPVRDWDKWRNQKQKRLFVQAAERGAEPTDLMFGTGLVSGPGYEGGLACRVDARRRGTGGHRHGKPARGRALDRAAPPLPRAGCRRRTAAHHRRR